MNKPRAVLVDFDAGMVRLVGPATGVKKGPTAFVPLLIVVREAVDAGLFTEVTGVKRCMARDALVVVNGGGPGVLIVGGPGVFMLAEVLEEVAGGPGVLIVNDMVEVLAGVYVVAEVADEEDGEAGNLI